MYVIHMESETINLVLQNLDETDPACSISSLHFIVYSEKFIRKVSGQANFWKIFSPLQKIQPFHIIFQSLATGFRTEVKANLLKSYLYAANYPTTVLILVTDKGMDAVESIAQGRQLPWFPFIKGAPCTKSFITFSKPNMKIKTLLWFQGYSSSRLSNWTLSIIKISSLLKNPYVFHRRHLWSGYGKQIVAKLGTKSLSLLQIMRQNLHKLSSSYARFLFYNKDIGVDPVVEISFLLASAHNMSLDLYSIRDDIEAPKRTKQLGEILEGPYDLFVDNSWLSFLTGLRYYSLEKTDIIYCSNHSKEMVSKLKKIVEHGVWLAPFSTKLWIFIFCLPFVTAAVTAWGQGLKVCFKEFLKCTMLLLLYPSIAYKRNKIFLQSILVTGALFWCFYQNQITSLAVAPEPKKLPENLKQVVQSGYKIMFYDTPRFSPLEQYKQEFKKFGILKELQTAFYLTNLSSGGYMDICSVELSKGNSVARLKRSEEVFKRSEKESELKFNAGRATAEINCNIVPAGMKPTLLLWHMFTANRPWLITSIQRLIDAGLSIKWNNWSEYLSELLWQKRYGRNNSERSPDTINFPKFMCLLLALMVVETLSLAIFLSTQLGVHLNSCYPSKRFLFAIRRELTSQLHIIVTKLLYCWYYFIYVYLPKTKCVAKIRKI